MNKLFQLLLFKDPLKGFNNSFHPRLLLVFTMSTPSFYYRDFFSSLAGTSIITAIVVGLPVIVSAKTPQEIAQIAIPLTVQINTPMLPGGSGVLISRQGNTYTVLTANHVVKRPDLPYTVRVNTGKEYPINHIQSLQIHSDNVDLAVITFDSTDSYVTATVGDSDQALVGSDIYVVGYPVAGVRSGAEREFEFTSGMVTSRPNNRPQGYTLRYNAVTRGGMSGGPVFDSNGRVIGIHGQGDTEGSLQAESGTSIAIKTGFNSAIPINIFLGIRPQTSTASSKVVRDRDPVDTEPASIDTPKTAKDFYAQGLSRFDQGDQQGATVAFNQVLQLNPNDVLAYYYKGISSYTRGQKQEAIESFTQTLQLKPNYADAYYQRAVARYELGDKQGAIIDFTEALRLAPNDVYSYQNRGIVRRSLGDGSGTLEDFDQVVKLAPSSRAYYNRALARSMVQDQQGTLDDFSEAIQLEPKFTAAYVNRALTRRRMGDRQGAINDLTVVVGLEPNNGIAYYNRALFRRDLGDQLGGVEDLQNAASLFQQQGDTSNYQKAVEILNRLQGGNRNIELSPTRDIGPSNNQSAF